jgi:transcriptional/translational regulatory protein YebC/TACO1
MEIINLIAELVTKVGFPIACCCVLFMQHNKLQDTLKDISITMQKMSDAIEDIDDVNEVYTNVDIED